MDLAAPVRDGARSAGPAAVQRRSDPSAPSLPPASTHTDDTTDRPPAVAAVTSGGPGWDELPLPYAEPEPALRPDPGEEFVRRLTVLDLSPGGTGSSSGEIQRVLATPGPAPRTQAASSGFSPAAEYSRPLETPVVRRSPDGAGNTSDTTTIARVVDAPGPSGSPQSPADMPLVSPATVVQRQADEVISRLPPISAVGSIVSATSNKSPEEDKNNEKAAVDIDKVTEEVWQNIRRRLRVERERLRGWI
ncbi:MAG: hypothetical protein ACM3S1_07920 [Hyphomicrobiales bacterium]